MNADEAVRSGYAVVQSDLVDRGQIIVLNGEASGGRPVAAAHPLDFIAVAWPNPHQRLDRAVGWILGQAFKRFGDAEARIGAAR